MRKLIFIPAAAAALLLLLASCFPVPPGTPTPDVNQIVIQTFAAYTVEAALTQGALPSATLPPPPPTETPEENAPNPLPATNTGIILNNGECFNLDTGAVAAAPDAQCDLWLVQPALFRQVNGAKLSGYGVSFTPPTRSKCAGAKFDPGDLAIQTDLHMCFLSNEGKVGFIVVRQYRGGVPSTGIVFDYWIFR